MPGWTFQGEVMSQQHWGGGFDGHALVPHPLLGTVCAWPGEGNAKGRLEEFVCPGHGAPICVTDQRKHCETDKMEGRG